MFGSSIRRIPFVFLILVILSPGVFASFQCHSLFLSDWTKYTQEYYRKGGTDFDFRIARGIDEQNYLIRNGSNQSHTVINSGEHAYIVTAFPAGNSAAGFFPVVENNLVFLTPVSFRTFSNATEHGVSYTVEVNKAHLTIDHITLGSTRDARDYEHVKIKYDDVKVTPQLTGAKQVLYARERLDRGGRYVLQLNILNGTARFDDQGRVSFTSDRGKNLQIQFTVITSEKAFAPLPINDIFIPSAIAKMSVADIQSALYLINAEKILAGSWRYQTQFGRDTIFTLIYLADLLQPRVLEVALSSVMERMMPNGNLAHEEHIGEMATRMNIEAGKGPVSTPILADKMVDTALLLAPLFAIYQKKVGDARAAAFLSQKAPDGRTFRDALAKNLIFVLRRTNAFAKQPNYQNLISFVDWDVVGDWRDSGNAHGSTTDEEERELQARGIKHKRSEIGGRYSFGVNVALAPSALRIASEIYANPELGLFSSANAAAAQRAYDIWSTQARKFFLQSVSGAKLSQRSHDFLQEQGLNSAPDYPDEISYSALSLDRNGKPIEVIHSDEGFDLLLNHPSFEAVEQAVDNLLRPFPYGLMTPVGMVVSNPFLIEDPVMRARFNRDQYHGFVVWGCDMVKMERGLAHQLQRTDLPQALREKVLIAHKALWSVMDKMQIHKKEELWSWEPVNSQMTYKPFREANALQLWNLSWMLLKNPYVNYQARP